VHLDQWSLTEVLRLHLEASGAFRGHNLQNWRYQQRGGFRLSDDPGFQFCREEPQILGSLQSQNVYELRQEDTRLVAVLDLQLFLMDPDPRGSVNVSYGSGSSWTFLWPF
jgi:hypothetical protein